MLCGTSSFVCESSSLLPWVQSERYERLQHSQHSWCIHRLARSLDSSKIFQTASIWLEPERHLQWAAQLSLLSNPWNFREARRPLAAEESCRRVPKLSSLRVHIVLESNWVLSRACVEPLYSSGWAVLTSLWIVIWVLTVILIWSTSLWLTIMYSIPAI